MAESNAIQIAGRYAIAVGITASAMAWLAPAGSAQLMTLENRTAFWLITVMLGWLQMIVIARGLRNVMDVQNMPPIAVFLLAAFLGAVPLTFEVRSIWSSMRSVPGEAVPFDVAYTTTLLITLMFSLIQWSFVEHWPILSVSGKDKPQSPGEPSGVSDADMADGYIPVVAHLRRRPDGVTGEIVCLSSEDHYVRVHTMKGSGLVLNRLGDAMEELRDKDGAQVHRSWWVARHAVDRVTSSAGSRKLVLKNGLHVPIGRNFAPKLRESGWFS